MPRRRLPIGIQNFREVRETDCYYVDKTAYIVQMLEEGKHYFLTWTTCRRRHCCSRPAT